MSKRLIQDLHAGISRRDWSAVEAAANRLRDEIEQATRILAGTDIGSIPNDYPFSKLAALSVPSQFLPDVQGNGELGNPVTWCLLHVDDEGRRTLADWRLFSSEEDAQAHIHEQPSCFKNETIAQALYTSLKGKGR